MADSMTRRRAIRKGLAILNQFQQRKSSRKIVGSDDPSRQVKNLRRKK